MTFLQPFILWALPLVLLPIIIHLLNRMRHRPQPWAATRFLISATRSSVNNAKLRQWLILLLRVLAVLALVLFLSRPLAGGWLGWALSPAPDAILILLDRSASMETGSAGAGSKRQQAIESLAQAAKEFEESSHLVLIENAFRAPQSIRSAATLRESSATAATDTTADIPGMLATAFNWLVENRAGTAELWIASDLQKSNWQPDDARWKSLVAQFNGLPQKIRIRLLALDGRTGPNRSVELKELVRRPRADESELQIVVDVQSDAAEKVTVPLTVSLDGTTTQRELTLEGQLLRWRNRIQLPKQAGQGWGWLEIPADANRRDNTTYFVYGSETALRASIVTSDQASAKLLQLAISAGSGKAAPRVDLVLPTELTRAVWEDNTLVVWKEPLPEGPSAQRIRAFIAEGGSVLFLPPDRPDAQRFEGVGWGNVETTSSEKPFRILRWNEDEGPLAKSDEGLSLPLNDATFQRRQAILGASTSLAAFDDGSLFLVRQPVGRGEAYFCASRPDRDWSSLGEGPVLVPMLQRLLQAGGRRLQQVMATECGQLSVVDLGRHWEPIDGTRAKDIRTESGVYRSGERLLAVNRPLAEDNPEILDGPEAERLFGTLGVRMLQEKRRTAESLEGEVWRIFVFLMLTFLVVEGILILPSADPRRGLAGAPAQPRGRSALAEAQP